MFDTLLRKKFKSSPLATHVAVRWLAREDDSEPPTLFKSASADTLQDLVADYRSLGLTLGRHPLELLRRKLWKMRVTPSERLKDLENESWVRVAGIVTHRQRPGTASGVVFATLEDESGIVNLIIWSRVFDQYRAEILRSRLMLVKGQLQSEQGVIHVVAEEIEDQSALLGALRTESRDFH